MSTSFPTSLQDLDPTRGTTGQALSNPNHITHHTTEDDTIEALQTKVGVDSSAVATSIDYLLKNTSSSNPGHKHTFTSLSDFNVSSPADKEVLKYNSSSGKWENKTGAIPTVHAFTGSGTWSKPSGLRYAVIELVGAGGGGGGGAGGGGGGGGGYSRKIVDAGSLGATETVTIGAAGTAGATGSPPTQGGSGGTTSFGSHCQGSGGGGGSISSTSPNTEGGGAGGVGSGGDININGNGGTAGAIYSASNNVLYGGAGGGSYFGGGARGPGRATGIDGTAYGGGGSGGGDASNGGAGAAGYVVVTEYYI